MLGRVLTSAVFPCGRCAPAGCRRLSSQSAVHPVALSGYASPTITSYEAGRTGYRADELTTILDRVGLPRRVNQAVASDSVVRVVEVGAGSGKFTRAFHGFVPTVTATPSHAYDHLHLTAVEPSDLRFNLEETFSAKGNEDNSSVQVDVVNGVADALGFPDSSVDVVISAQAFHWFSTPETVAEWVRVLKPAGGIGVLWNMRNTESPWMRELEDLIDAFYALDLSVPRQHHRQWATVFDGVPGVSDLSFDRIDFRRECTPEELLNNVRSLSVVAVRPQDEIDRVVADVTALIDRIPADHVVEGDASTLSLPYYTDIASARTTG